MSKQLGFTGPFDKQHGEADQTLVKSKRHQIYISLWRHVSWNESLLVLCKVLTLFVNMLTADDKHFLVNRDNLRQPIHTQLSQKKTLFYDFVSTILKSRLNFEHFWTKDDPHSWCICQIADSEKYG